MKQNIPSTLNINQQNSFPSNMLNLNANPFITKPTKKANNQLNNTPLSFLPSQSNRIKEVYADNFVQEIKNISNYLEKYPYVGMDTEFPGVVYACPVANEEFYYKYIKVNVDKLKLIQLGITLTNDKGESPPNYSTWQFNLNFDIEKDEHSNESITMLYNSGIDFNLMKNIGIPHDLFAEYFLVSGLVLNEKITWICFNGSSDFAYLLKYLINDSLPEDEPTFIESVNRYFPNLYDIKYLVNDNEAYKGGLNRLAKELEVERNGEIHQAGSDSQVTSNVFFRLIGTNAISNSDLNMGKNVIYGIGQGADAMETINYTQFKPGLDISYLLQNINNMNLGMNFKNNNP